MSTDIAEKQSAELAKLAEEASAGALAGIDRSKLTLPVIKVTQQLSREVTRGDVESGHFVNSMTGEDLGDSIELVVCHAFEGRFYAPKDEDRVYVASGKIAPSNWPDQYAGQPFADIADAHEQWSRRSNDPNDSHQWGSGPLIQTTHNYIGFRPEEPEIPVRLSLKGTSSKTAGKIDSLLVFAGQPWNATIALATEQRENRKQQPYFVVTATQGRQTTADERERAIHLSLTSQAAEHQYTGDADESKEARASAGKPKGGLDVA